MFRINNIKNYNKSAVSLYAINYVLYFDHYYRIFYYWKLKISISIIDNFSFQLQLVHQASSPQRMLSVKWVTITQSFAQFHQHSFLEVFFVADNKMFSQLPKSLTPFSIFQLQFESSEDISSDLRRIFWFFCCLFVLISGTISDPNALSPEL